MYCSLTKHTKMTNKCTSWYGLKASGIYLNNKGAWHQIFWKIIFRLNLAPIGGNFAMSVRCLHMILHDFFLYFTTRSYVSKILFQTILNEFVRLPMMTSKSNEIWQFQGVRSRDLTTGYRNMCVVWGILKVWLYHQHDILLHLLLSTLLHVSTTNLPSSGN